MRSIVTGAPSISSPEFDSRARESAKMISETKALAQIEFCDKLRCLNMKKPVATVRIPHTLFTLFISRRYQSMS